MPGVNGADVIETVQVQTVADPRSEHSQSDIERNFAARIELMGLAEKAVNAVEQIVQARSDIGTIKSLIGKRNKDGEDESMSALADRADELTETLNELEKSIRVPPETKGIVYTADKLTSRIGIAQFYIGSTKGAPTSAAQTYIDIAKAETSKLIGEVNAFLGGDLADFRDAVSDAGIGLLADVKAVDIS